MPMQPRGPAPKGRYANGCRSFLASSVNLEGAEMETGSRNAFCSWFHVFHLHLKRWLYFNLSQCTGQGNHWQMLSWWGWCP